MKELLQNWRDTLPLAVLAVLACVGLFFLLRKKSEDAAELERQRRAYLNRIGRIVEGQVLEFTDHGPGAPDDLPGEAVTVDAGKQSAKDTAKPSGVSGILAGGRSSATGIQKLLYYTYSISGVTYETAQDITGFEERAALDKAVIGKAASVKYDPANPSNSILIADDWSGLH